MLGVQCFRHTGRRSGHGELRHGQGRSRGNGVCRFGCLRIQGVRVIVPL